MSIKNRWVLLVGMGGIVVLVDRVSKFVVLKLGWDVVFNTGVAWGWGGEWGFFSLVPVVVIVFLGIYLWRNLRNVQMVEVVAWGLIVGGAVSNILDRWWYGGVLDWIVVFDWFPWFNLADVCINLGFIGLLLREFIFKSKN